MELGKIFEITDRFHDSAILFTAVKKKVFDQTINPVTVDDVVQNYGWDSLRTRLFLNALVSLGFLVKNHETYQNTKETTEFLHSESDRTVIDVVNHQRLQWEMWGSMTEILEGKGTRFYQPIRFKQDTVANDTFNRAMAQLTGNQYKDIINLGVIKSGDFIVDLCGGHGSYIVKICTEVEGTLGQIWDLKETEQSALININSNNLRSRIGFNEFNVYNDSFSPASEVDVVLLNDCLHYFTKPVINKLFKEIYNGVSTTGSLVVTTQFLDDSECYPLGASLFSLNMSLSNENGELHSTNWIASSLKNAGFEVEISKLGSLNRTSLLLAQKSR